MREHSTKLIAFVVIVLSAACLGFLHNSIASADANQGHKSYLPIVPVSPEQANGDLNITHMSLYQSVQNQSNDVTLVASKPALLRVYAQSTHQGGAALQTNVTLEAYRDGIFLGSLDSGPKTVPALALAEDMDSTYNFDLPPGWLRGRLVLKVKVDSPDSVREFDENNNLLESSFVFRAVPALDLTIVPINYVDTVTGKTYREAGHDPISQWLLSAYPISDINVTIHPPFTFTGDLRRGDEWGRLLQAITDLWGIEVGPGSSHIYYGLVPNSAPEGGSWFNGGISGLGWIGQRVALGLDVGPDTGALAGHEIGHNFGRRHAPCGDPGGIDPHYPYPNASIGVYGVDTADETLMDPDSTHDMMSYCGPEWVSDYTYEGLLQDQAARANRPDTAAGEGYFITAQVEGDRVGAANISVINKPFLLTGNRGNYEVQLVGKNGEIIGAYPAELVKAEEDGVLVQFLMAHIPAPMDRSAVAKVQFLFGGAIAGEQTLDE